MEQSYCYRCMEPIAQAVCPHCGFRSADYQSATHHLKPGTKLRDRYLIGTVIGEGGFGITYVGRDPVFERTVAIKEFYMPGYVLRDHTISDEVKTGGGTYGEMFEKNREKFLHEARVLAKFEGEDGVVGVRDFFEENNTAYLVMDLLRGMTLRQYVEKHGNLSGAQVLKLLEPVFHALENIHAHGLIHRDISPDNIMVTDDGGVKLLDFGAARQISERDIKSLSVILKPGYAPEEQYRSKGKQGPWTDLYALCATMYRCITGIVPDDAMERMFDDKLVPPAELGCDCSEAMSRVLMKGLSIRQADRYQSIPELWDALNGKSKDRTQTIPREIFEGKTMVPDTAWIKTEDMPKKVNEPITGERPAVPQKAPMAKPEPKTIEPVLAKAMQPRKKKSKLPLLLGVCVAAIVLAVVLIFTLSGKPEVTVDGTTFTVPTTFVELEELGWTVFEPQLTQELDSGEQAIVVVQNESGEIIDAYCCNTADTAQPVAECTIYGLEFDTHNIDSDIHTVTARNVVLGKTTLDNFSTSAKKWEEIAQGAAYVYYCNNDRAVRYTCSFGLNDVVETIKIFDESVLK